VQSTIVMTQILHLFDARVVDGLVNGTASWTRAIVFGYQNHWKEKHLGARVFLALGIVIAAWTGWSVGEWLLAGSAGWWGSVGAVAAAGAAGLLALYLFWAGAGGFDKHVVDGTVNLAAYLSGFTGLVFRKFQTGRVQTYIVLAAFGVIVLYYALR
jgi:hypothetical protein